MRGLFPAPHHHDPNEMLLNFCILGHGGCTWQGFDAAEFGWSRMVLTCDAAASQKQGRCGAESADEARSHVERHCCITKKGLEELSQLMNEQL